jgi:hypothetical protein
MSRADVKDDDPRARPSSSGAPTARGCALDIFSHEGHGPGDALCRDYEVRPGWRRVSAAGAPVRAVHYFGNARKSRPWRP